MYLPRDKKERVSKLVYLYHQTRDEMSDARDMWLAYQKMYKSDMGPVGQSDYPLIFDIFLPHVHAVIETLIPRFVHGLIYRNPIIAVSSAHPETPWDNVAKVSNVLNNKWMTDFETFATFTMMTKEATKYGTAFGKVGHERIPQVMKKRELVAGIPVDREVQIYSVNRPKLYHCDLFDVYPDLRNGVNIKKCAFICHKMIQDLDEMRYGPIKYENLDELEEAGDWTNDDFDFKRERRDMTGEYSRSDYEETKTEFFRPRQVLEFTVREWSKVGLTIKKIYVGNEKVWLGEEILNYWPWFKFTNCPQEHELMGYSSIAPIASLQMGINDQMNMSLTACLMALNKMYLVGDGAQANLDQFVLDPMGIIQVADISQVKELDYRGMDNAGLQLLSVLENSLQKATGIQDYMQGATPPRAEAATTVRALQIASEARIDCQSKWAERETISQGAELMILCAQDYQDEPEHVPSSEQEKFAAYDLYDMQGLFEFKATGAASGIQGLKRDSYMELAKVTGELLGEMMPMEARGLFASQIAETYDGLEGIGEIFSAVQRGLESKQRELSAQASSLANPGNPGMVPGAAGPPG